MFSINSVLPNFIRGLLLIAIASFSLGAAAEHHGGAAEKATAQVEEAMDKSEAVEEAEGLEADEATAEMDEKEAAAKEMKDKMEKLNPTG